MGWQDAPEVQGGTPTPKWAMAPEVAPTESEMMADLQAADAAGDTELAQHIAARIKAARVPSAGQAAMRGAVEGATVGILPKLAKIGPQSANTEAQLDWGEEPSAAETRAAGQRYQQAQQEARQAHPWPYGGAQVAGSILPLGVAASAAPVVRGAGLLPRMATAASQGGTAGLAYGLGTGENVQDVLTQTGLGVLGGGAAPAIGGALGAAARRLAGGLEGVAESAAVRSAGGTRAALRTATKGSPEAQSALGRFMLSEPDIQLRSPALVREGAQSVAADAGQKIGALADQATQAGAKVDLKGAFDAALKDPRIADLGKNLTTRGALGGQGGHGMGPPGIKDVMTDWLSQHGDTVSPATAHDIRRQLDALAAWDKMAPQPVKNAWRAARQAVDSSLDDAMSTAGLGDEWATQNSRFSAARKLTRGDQRGLADIGAERRAGNEWMSPSEKGSAIAGGALALTSHPAGAVLPVAWWLGRRYGMPVTARAADALAGVLGKASVPGAALPLMSMAPVGADDIVPALTAAMRKKTQE